MWGQWFLLAVGIYFYVSFVKVFYISVFKIRYRKRILTEGYLINGLVTHELTFDFYSNIG